MESIKETIYIEDFKYDEVYLQSDSSSEISAEEALKKAKEALNIRSLSNITVSKSAFIKDEYSNIYSNYDVTKKRIGKGGFGTVFKATHKQTGEIRAIKRIRIKKIKQVKRFKNEIYALKALDHPNIIKLYEIYHDEDYSYLVTEL